MVKSNENSTLFYKLSSLNFKSDKHVESKKSKLCSFERSYLKKKKFQLTNTEFLVCLSILLLFMLFHNK